MLVIAQQTIPRGGTLTIDPIGDGETMSFRVTAAGLNARMPQNIADLLSASSTASVDAHAVQPYYTRLLAQACGLTVTLAPDGEKVIVVRRLSAGATQRMVNQRLTIGGRIHRRRLISLLSPFFSICSTNIKRFA